MFGLLLDSDLGFPLAVAGAVASLVPLLIAILLFRARIATVERLLQLVDDGNSHEARVLARSAGGGMRPVLEALSGASTAPSSTPPVKELFLAVLSLLPAIAVPIYASTALARASAERIGPEISAILAGAAILAPLAMIAATAILQIGLRATRVVRAACVTILARQARTGDTPKRDPKPSGEMPKIKTRDEAKQ